MPTYEYICANGHSFEEFQSIVAEPVKVCPLCGGSASRKISGGTGLIFKGSGFYITDYARKSSVGSGNDTGSSSSSKPATETKKPPTSESSTEKKKD